MLKEEAKVKESVVFTSGRNWRPEITTPYLPKQDFPDKGVSSLKKPCSPDKMSKRPLKPSST